MGYVAIVALENGRTVGFHAETRTTVYEKLGAYVERHYRIGLASLLDDMDDADDEVREAMEGLIEILKLGDWETATDIYFEWADEELIVAGQDW